MATRAEISQRALQRKNLWRSYKQAGRSRDEIATAMGVSRALVHAVTQPEPGERICPSCCQQLLPEVELPTVKKKKL